MSISEYTRGDILIKTLCYITYNYYLAKVLLYAIMRLKGVLPVKSVVVSVKMPITLKDRIDTLALKGLTNRNHWIVRTLIRESKPKKPS